MNTFPKNFIWGAATAAYQIEGAHDADGKGPSVWDHMARWPGKIFQGETGDIACDHYHRLEEDLDLMKAIGLNAYRFSFSWSRILPEGTGRVNEAGLAFYDRLIDGLLARGIQPWGTLFHWCYPLELHRRGGWLNAESPRWMEEYATVVARRFGDRIGHWLTLNEPQMFMNLGYDVGCHAPGLKLPSSDIVRSIHHVLLAHGRAVQALRTHCAKPAMIGFAQAVTVSAVDPAYAHDPEVLQHAHDGQFLWQPGAQVAKGVSVWCDPVFLRKYPEAFVSHHGGDLPKDWECDLDHIATPLDFCGQNIYAAWGAHSRNAAGGLVYLPESHFGKGFPKTHFRWPVTPEALYWGPVHFHRRYAKPIVITENGLSCPDWVNLDGKVEDPQRIDFTRRYLRELHRSIRDGVDVRGYFHWSFMDNFEWAEGYEQRFGLVHVDFQTQKRTPKSSAAWYRGIIESNGRLLF
jgi:beta-glucosidase